MNRCGYYIIFFMLLTATAGAQVGLQCEQLTDPQGIDVVKPRLSWVLAGSDAEGGRQGLRQTAYQLLVASSAALLAKDQGDLWNSGKVMSGQSRMVVYSGVVLGSRRDCYWKVRVWSTDTMKMASASGWSAVAHWSMGLLGAADWKARWIGYDQGFPWDSVSKFSRLSARYFRKEFHVDGPVREATLYIIGLGHYEAFVNGHGIGDQVLAEAPTDYTQAVKYNTYDVTQDCRSGVNAIGVVLGNGRFFTMRPKYKPKKIKEFGFPKLLLQLEITYADGRRQQIVSDGSWSFTADGPIRTNNEYDGEEYDATREMPGWAEAGFDAGGWMTPQLVAAPGGRIGAQMNEPIRVMAKIQPVSIRALRTGVWVMDMGQNMAGWVQMKVRGSRGQQVVLRFAETLQADGSLNTANLRDAKATDSYTLKGEGEEVWHPVFVFHGFRYVEVSGYPGEPSATDFEGQVVYDDMATIGQIHTSNAMLDSIIRNAWWGIAANYKGMPVDCPQRNERMPWLGDRTIGALGESYLFDNGNLYSKWLDDIAESQREDGALPDVAPAYWNYYSDDLTWPAAFITIAGMLYEQYGDVRPIERHYAAMKKWLTYMSAQYERDGIMTKDKYGDWCVPPESLQLIHAKDSSRLTDGRLIATAYYFHLLGLMQTFAGLLHQPADVKAFREKMAVVKTAFNREFRNKAGGYYGNNTVTANLLPMYFGLATVDSTDRVIRHIVDKIETEDHGHISTGVIGTQWLMRGLTEYGHVGVALQIAANKTYPGWGYMVEHGATTIWELWNGDSADPEMNSRNHVMLLGDLLTWCWQDLAGIKPMEAGFRTIFMHPYFPDSLSFVEASYRTPYGLVKSAWRRKDGVISWDISVPPNSRAVVAIPGEGESMVGSGQYHFNINKQ